MAIVLDAMGSDTYPDPEIRASVIAASELNEEIILVGNEAILAEKLKTINTSNAPVTIFHAPDVMEMTDKPVDASKRKQETSMAVGMRLVKEGKAKAFVSAGNTGGAYFTAVTTLRRLQNISRPALTTTIPTRKARCVFMDTGANADCRPEFLLEFAVMGSVYAEKVLGIANPRVALLSNGEEAGKGNQLVKESYPLLKASSLNFVGNVEPKEIYNGDVDVVVADGFSGNVFIKTSEAVAKFITTTIKEEIKSTFISTLGGLLAKPAFNKLRKLMDPAEVGAAMLLGVDGYVFIGHGRSDERALVAAIKLAHKAVSADLLDAMKVSIQEKLTSINKE